MHRAGNQTFLVNVAASKPDREYRANDGNCLEEFFSNFPGASSDNSFFRFRHHVRCVRFIDQFYRTARLVRQLTQFALSRGVSKLYASMPALKRFDLVNLMRVKVSLLFVAISVSVILSSCNRSSEPTRAQAAHLHTARSSPT